ncbi:MAG: hypothetical protein AB7G35_20245, partial [Hyphomicrobiaceae bacterium]
FGRRLKTLKGLTPYEAICKQWTSEPERFRLNPIHQMPGLNTYPPLSRHGHGGVRLRQASSRSVPAASRVDGRRTPGRRSRIAPARP